MADKLTKEQLADLQEGFELYDPNRTGQLPVEELGRVARACGATPTEDDLADFFDDFGEEFVDFETFVDFMAAHTERKPEAELRVLFSAFDRAGTGKIIAADLSHVLSRIGDALSEDETKALLQEVGVDKDGCIAFEDFIRVCTKSHIDTLERARAQTSTSVSMSPHAHTRAQLQLAPLMALLPSQSCPPTTVGIHCHSHSPGTPVRTLLQVMMRTA